MVNKKNKPFYLTNDDTKESFPTRFIVVVKEGIPQSALMRDTEYSVIQNTKG